MEKRRLAVLLGIITVLCFILTGCLSIVGNILSGIDAVFRFAQAFGDDDLPEIAVYGSDNPIAVGFRDGKLVAFWDVETNYRYVLTVTGSDKISTVYDPEDAAHPEYEDYYGNDCFYLENTGLDYADDFSVSLKAISSQNTYKKYSATYEGLSKIDYTTYTANVPGGFTTIDHYIATRYEMFEYFAYMLIFRPEATQVAEAGSTYEQVVSDVYIAYDYAALYDSSVNADAAFESEVMCAVASFEDSAAYNYNYKRDGNICTYTLKFNYDTNPYLISSSKDMYVNATSPSEAVHYDVSTSHDRNFPIDERAQEVVVSSSDQLYFAIKKGYKPAPVKGSNAYYIYNELRRILALINKDSDNAPLKIHHIYDYMVNTVIYDYDFVDNILEQQVDDQSVFFAYNCLYMEGVLGFKNGTFREKERVAICDGLSKAFLCFTQIEGIDSIKVSGTASGGAHAWNKVKVNSRWYLVDVTWGNQLNSGGNKEYMSHDYLMTSDDSAHREDEWYYYPKATGKYNFIFS